MYSEIETLSFGRAKSPIFPLERMPVELLHMISARLGPTDVAKMRVISRKIAYIGLQYLVPTFHLKLKRSSYDRLLEIAHHPVLSRFLSTLLCDHTFLMVYGRSSWEKFIESPEFLAANRDLYLEDSEVDSTVLSWRAFIKRSTNPQRRNRYSDGELDRAYLIYQKYCVEQAVVVRSNFFPEKLIEALTHIPNVVTLGLEAHTTFDCYQAELQTTLGASCRETLTKSDSLPVIRSLLLAIDQAGCGLGEINNQPCVQREVGQGEIGYREGNQVIHGIRNLQLADFNWVLLTKDAEVVASINRSLRFFVNIDIHFPIASWPGGPWVERGRFHEFITSAPDLQQLKIAFDHQDADLREIVGEYHWRSLTRAHFKMILVHEEDLVGFCDRHRHTLVKLSLGDLYLALSNEVPSFRSMFSKIRRLLKLREASIYGRIHDEISWPMDDGMGNMIEEYLVHYTGNDDLATYMSSDWFP